MKKFLPVTKPQLILVPTNTNMLNIIKTYNLPWDWIASNLNQIFIEADIAVSDNDRDFPRIFAYDFIAYHSNPQFEYFNLIPELLYSSLDKFKKLIEELIMSNYYIVLSIDMYYIPEYKFPKHGSHLLMIYGIDEDQLGVIDFIEDQYSFVNVSLVDVYRAFIENNNRDLVDASFFEAVKANENKDIYPFNKTIYVQLISDYLNSFPTWTRFCPDLSNVQYIRREKRKPLIWGRNCMQNYQTNFSELIDIISRNLDTPISLRYFHTFAAYKELVKINFEYILEHDFFHIGYEVGNEILSELNVISSYFKMVEILAIKALIDRKSDRLEKKYDELEQILLKDYWIYERIYNLAGRGG